MSDRPLTFYEFFAGGGMARLGLGAEWRCLFANDFDAGKAAAYRANFADAADHLFVGDVWSLDAGALAGQADLAWASSPCQDFSLAGARSGLAGKRSSALMGFWALIEALDDAGRAPPVVVIENVVGLLSSRGGADFAALCEALNARGYRFGALEVDASAFTPQSRPRIFVVATRLGCAHLEGPSPFQTRAIRQAYERLSRGLQDSWVWWSMAAPLARNTSLADCLEPDGAVRWRSEAETVRLLDQMDERHREAVETRRAAGGRHVGAAYRRIRKGVQRAEARFDGLAGCLRTPKGGSSKQLLVAIEDGAVRSRWLTAREGARLMGMPDDYRLPRSETAGQYLVGDGVAVPVVRALAAGLLEPLILAPVQIMAAE